MWKEILTIIGMLALMCVIFAGAYFTSRWVGNQYQGNNLKKGRIQILDRSFIGKSQAIIVAKVDERVFLLGTTAQNISLISELDPESFSEPVSDEPRAVNFLDYLKDAVKPKNDKKTGGSIDDGKDGATK